MTSKRRWRAVAAVCCGCGVLMAGARAQDAGERTKGGRRQVFHRLDQAAGAGSGILGTGAKAVSSLLDLASPFGDDLDDYDDPDLLLAEELLSGDGRLDAMRRLVNLKELEEIWGNPKAAHRLLQESPVFRTMAGVGELADKDEDDFTREDGLFVLTAMRRLADRGLQHMEDVVGQEGIVDKMQYYTRAASEGGDPVIRDLFERVEAGDVGATNELHDRVFDDLWGGVIDREAMGSSEQEPQATVALRKVLMQEQPDVWSMLTQEDPTLKRLLEDPLSPVRQVYDLSGGSRTTDHRAGL